jgi:hypothetical protein
MSAIAPGGAPTVTREDTMSNENPNVKLELTPEQRKQILEATGKDASVIEFTVEELEDRIAPAYSGLPVSQVAPGSVGLPTL